MEYTEAPVARWLKAPCLLEVDSTCLVLQDISKLDRQQFMRFLGYWVNADSFDPHFKSRREQALFGMFWLGFKWTGRILGAASTKLWRLCLLLTAAHLGTVKHGTVPKHNFIDEATK
jgi:hypothetical protein